MKGRSRYGHFVLVLVLMAVGGVAIVQPHEFASAVTPPPVWFANYESGNWKTYFDGVLNGRTGQTCSVSLKVVNSPPAPTPLGIYSGFYYKKSGPSTNTEPCQWAEHEVLSSGLSNYVQQVVVMVPSHFPNGSLMTLTDWQSFQTGHLCSSRDCTGTDLMYTVDANLDRTPHLWIQGQGTHQSLRIPYPVDQWFTVTIAVSIDTTGAPDSHIAASLNGVQFASWVGTIPASLTLWRFHNGLYVGRKQGSFSVYNDEDYLWATTSTSTVTTSSTLPSSTMVTATTTISSSTSLTSSVSTNSSTTSTSTTTAASTSTVTSSNSSTASTSVTSTSSVSSASITILDIPLFSLTSRTTPTTTQSLAAGPSTATSASTTSGNSTALFSMPYLSFDSIWVYASIFGILYLGWRQTLWSNGETMSERRKFALTSRI